MIAVPNWFQALAFYTTSLIEESPGHLVDTSKPFPMFRESNGKAYRDLQHFLLQEMKKPLPMLDINISIHSL